MTPGRADRALRRGLLERFADPAASSRREGWADGEQVVASVLEHLCRLLNTRRGSAPAAPGYGIPPLSDLTEAGTAAITEIQSAIRATIAENEPRLRLSHIEHVAEEEDPGRLRFRIHGRIAWSRAEIPTHFQTLIDPAGAVTVER